MLKEIAPPNLLKDPIIKALLESTDPQLQKVKEQIISVIIYPRIDEIEDESLLDLLAWQFHVEGYELAQTIEEKRDLVKNAIELHKHKGTKYAVQKALESVGIEGNIEEWFEYGGKPYLFRITTDITEKSGIDTQKLLDVVNSYKNERSWLEALILKLRARADIYTSARASAKPALSASPSFSAGGKANIAVSSITKPSLDASPSLAAKEKVNTTTALTIKPRIANAISLPASANLNLSGGATTWLIL